MNPQCKLIHCPPPHKGTQFLSKTHSTFFCNFLAFFCDPADAANLICGSAAFSKSSLNIQKFPVHILLKPSLENLEHYFASVWDVCNCVTVWTLFDIASLGLEWKLTFFRPIATAVFHICWHIECIFFTASSFRIWNSSAWNLSPTLALFIVMIVIPPEACLTSHYRLSDSRQVTIPSWLSGALRSFCIVRLCILATSS